MTLSRVIAKGMIVDALAAHGPSTVIVNVVASYLRGPGQINTNFPCRLSNEFLNRCILLSSPRLFLQKLEVV